MTGNLVTARKPDDLPAFCREILKLLEGSRITSEEIEDEIAVVRKVRLR